MIYACVDTNMKPELGPTHDTLSQVEKSKEKLKKTNIPKENATLVQQIEILN